MTGFSAGPHHDTGCIAINDGWHSEVPAPSARDLAAVNAAMPPMPTAAQQNDPKFMNEWRVRWHTAQANPVVALTNNRLDWLNGPARAYRRAGIG